MKARQVMMRCYMDGHKAKHIDQCVPIEEGKLRMCNHVVEEEEYFKEV